MSKPLKDMPEVKEAVFLMPLPTALDKEVVKQSVEITNEVFRKVKEHKENLLGQIKEAREKLRALEEQYHREFGKEP